MNNKKKRIKLFALSFALVILMNAFAMPFSVIAATSVTDCIKQMIVYYRDYQSLAETDIQRLIDEMAKTSEKKATAWRKIMDYWRYVSTQLIVNIDIVPDNLPTDESFAIMILGKSLESDGSLKTELIDRLTMGKAVADAYPNAYIVVTGGIDDSATHGKTEGGAMAEWLIGQGVAESRIIVEEKAADTAENAINSFKILRNQYPDVTSYTVVTSDYHMHRSCLLFEAANYLASADNGKEPFKILSNAASYTNTLGSETITKQANGVAAVAGVSLSGVSVSLSRLVGLKVALADNAFSGDTLALDVTATYHNEYARDVSPKVKITGYDKALGANQTVTVSYGENGIIVSGDFNLATGKTDLFSTAYLSVLLEEAKDSITSAYTAASVANLKTKIAEAEAILTKTDPALTEVNNACAALKSAMAGLALLPNIARGKPVTSNHAGAKYPITNVNDGVITTGSYWGSLTATGDMPAKDAWLIMDLVGTYHVEAITVYPYWGGSRIYKYDLYGSTDGENWTKIASQTEDVYTTTGGFTYDINQTLSYVKIQGISAEVVGNASLKSLHIIEMEVYGTETDNICLNKPVTSSGDDLSSSSSASATCDKVTDGDHTSYWDGGAYSKKPYVTVDLEGLYRIDEINVTSYWQSANRYYRYEVYTSVDGVDFTKVAEKTSTDQETVLGTDFDLTAQAVYARYIKVVGIYNSANSSFHINEIRAFGSEITEDIRYIGLQTGDSALRFVGTIEEDATAQYDKVDLEVTFVSDGGKTYSFSDPTDTVYKSLNDKNGVAVAVKDSPYAANAACVYDAYALFAFGVTNIPAGSYTVTVTPVAYRGETKLSAVTNVYTNITVATNGTVTVSQ